MAVGSTVPVSARVHLGEIPVNDIAVEAYIGVLDSKGNIQGGETVSLNRDGEGSDGSYRFTGEFECRFCGRHGFMLRVMPKHRELGNIYEAGYLIWG